MLSASAALLIACQVKPSMAPRFEAEGPRCGQHQQELVSFVQALPDRALSVSTPIDLPESIIGEVPGAGALLEIDENFARFDGVDVAGRTPAERAHAVGPKLLAFFANEAARDLYVATPRNTEVEELRSYLGQVPSKVKVRLLVRMPASSSEVPSAEDSEAEARELASKLLSERDPATRAALSRQAFERFARCKAVHDAAEQVAQLPADRRWLALREALIRALPACRCSELAPESLKHIVVAEQRAGMATLAALPFGFVRDARCGASMPLRSIGKLLQQMERFDQEFAGSFQPDAVSFEKVLTDDRLLNTFCNALPGETLMALAKGRGTVYFKTGAAESCEAFRFEPLSPGAPMGTLHPVGAKGSSFHYWQGAEELRVFGPIGPGPSKPTDEREWPCDHNLKLTSVDADSVELEQGRWFFSEAACRTAPSSAVVNACYAHQPTP